MGQAPEPLKSLLKRQGLIDHQIAAWSLEMRCKKSGIDYKYDFCSVIILICFPSIYKVWADHNSLHLLLVKKLLEQNKTERTPPL